MAVGTLGAAQVRADVAAVVAVVKIARAAQVRVDVLMVAVEQVGAAQVRADVAAVVAVVVAMLGELMVGVVMAAAKALEAVMRS